MYLIVGLGNPGNKYEGTRHNVGFEVIDYISAMYGIKVNKLKHRALIGEGVIEGNKVVLVKPQTYMNLSGESILQINWRRTCTRGWKRRTGSGPNWTPCCPAWRRGCWPWTGTSASSASTAPPPNCSASMRRRPAAGTSARSCPTRSCGNAWKGCWEARRPSVRM